VHVSLSGDWPSTQHDRPPHDLLSGLMLQSGTGTHIERVVMPPSVVSMLGSSVKLSTFTTGSLFSSKVASINQELVKSAA